jgi:hypothetical protein
MHGDLNRSSLYTGARCSWFPEISMRHSPKMGIHGDVPYSSLRKPNYDLPSPADDAPVYVRSVPRREMVCRQSGAGIISYTGD